MGAARCGEIVLVLAIAIIVWPLAASGPSEAERARQFIAKHDAKVKPLEISAGMAWWTANTTGKDEDFKRKEDAQNRIDEALADPASFQELKALRDAVTAKTIDDPLVARGIEILYLQYLEKQVDPAMLKRINSLANEVEKKFNNYRAEVDGKQLSDSEVRTVLKSSTNSDRRRATWEASKGVGKAVEKELIELVKLRNDSARKLGFANFHDLYLFLNEQDATGIIKLFDELDELTRGPFLAAKAVWRSAVQLDAMALPRPVFPGKPFGVCREPG
jgi:peptidyl-dipeptidase A